MSSFQKQLRKMPLAEYFHDRPEYEQLEAVERGLADWDARSETWDLPDDFNFPWDDFYVKGLELTKRLAGLLKGSPPFNYPLISDPGLLSSGASPRRSWFWQPIPAVF